MLSRVQRGLERLYRIDATPAVGDFVIDAATRESFGVDRAPREQLLLREDQGALSVGLFICEKALANLAADDPSRRLHDGNLEDFLLVVEGVSHFVYVTWRAAADRTVSVLELELQAEVDKYVSCLLGSENLDFTRALRPRLFEDFALLDDLDDNERERYTIATTRAHRYSQSLEQRFVRRSRIGEMLTELRKFYRLTLAGKLDLIGAA